MKKSTILTALLILVILAGAWIHYGNYNIPGISHRVKATGSNGVISTNNSSTGEVNIGGADNISVKVLYSSQVNGIRVIEFVYENSTRYEYIYPFDGYLGYLFKVNVTNNGTLPAHLLFYVITNDGRKVWPEDHTAFSDYIQNIPRDVLCNSIRIPTHFSDDWIKNLQPNSTISEFLYYSVEIGEEPAFLYVEGRYSNGEAFNFTVPLNIRG